MTVYAESSAVLRWLFHEPRGASVLAALQEASKVVCSRLTLVECRRVIRRAVAEKRITAVEGGDLLALLARAATTWAVLDFTREVAQKAEGTFPNEPVRTLDAVHLASALVLRESIPGLVLMTSDERIRRNGLELGLEVIP